MSIVLFLGRNVKEYEISSKEKISQLLISESIRCELCTRSMALHSRYTRRIKETGENIEINIVWCSACRKWHALLPDFLLPHKHYSGNEIESVIIESESILMSQIETEASESTIRRWIRQINDRIMRTINILKILFGRTGHPVSETVISLGAPYNELEQLLEMAPYHIRSCLNKLGLANQWLGTYGNNVYI